MAFHVLIKSRIVRPDFGVTYDSFIALREGLFHDFRTQVGILGKNFSVLAFIQISTPGEFHGRIIV